MKVVGSCTFESSTHSMGGIKLVVSDPWLQRQKKKRERHRQNQIERPSLKSQKGRLKKCHIKTQIQKYTS